MHASAVTGDQDLPRQDCAATVFGGPPTVVDVGGLRLVVDPTFDDPGPHGYLTKTLGPAVPEDRLGPVDMVLVSHDAHPDDLDDRGRAFARAAPVILTVPGAADRPGAAAVGLAPWTTFTVTRPDDGGELTVLAVPAVHGPEDGERDAQGHINCEVTGFVLSGQGLPTLYVSGGNASIRAVAEISRRVPGIDAAVLNAGAARVKGKFRERPVSMDGRRAAAAVLGVSVVIPAHYRVPPAYGWNGPRPSKPAGQTSASEAGVSAVDGHVRHGTALRPTGALPRWPVKTRIR